MPERGIAPGIGQSSAATHMHNLARSVRRRRTALDAENCDFAFRLIRVCAHGLEGSVDPSEIIRSRRSSEDRPLRSRPAGLVITKAHGMSPLVKSDELALLVRTLPFNYSRAFLVSWFLDPNPPQPEIQLQRIAHYGRAAALCPLRLFFDERPNFGGQ
jgi:hypothetical protein